MQTMHGTATAGENYINNIIRAYNKRSPRSVPCQNVNRLPDGVTYIVSLHCKPPDALLRTFHESLPLAQPSAIHHESDNIHEVILVMSQHTWKPLVWLQYAFNWLMKWLNNDDSLLATSLSVCVNCLVLVLILFMIYWTASILYSVFLKPY